MSARVWKKESSPRPVRTSLPWRRITRRLPTMVSHWRRKSLNTDRLETQRPLCLSV
ncbi:hypothetical protein BDV34DRAFT_185320 [Aspergillus parasiticus]|uniref:Uncharacterized protein n=1 Tax=Aspergillus parasiticus TaxID=5067 RepID=A0A5N6E1X4_ASPPA|nr:hypothetical protein BDV34DRAFT_185320 [Aspergillus parasiticus]